MANLMFWRPQKPTAPALSALFDEPVNGFYACHSLSQIGPAALPILMEALSKDSPTANLHALYGMNDLGMNASSALPLVLKCLQSTNRAGDISIRNAAIETLGYLGGGTGESVRALVNLLDDSDPHTRGSAVQSLGSVGAQANHVVPTLTLALADPNFGVRWYATNALRAIAPDQFPTPPKSPAR